MTPILELEGRLVIIKQDVAATYVPGVPGILTLSLNPGDARKVNGIRRGIYAHYVRLKPDENGSVTVNGRKESIELAQVQLLINELI